MSGNFITANELNKQFNQYVVWVDYITYKEYCFIWATSKYSYAPNFYTCIKEEYLEKWIRALFPNLYDGSEGFRKVDKNSGAYPFYEGEAEDFYKEYLK